MAVFAIHQVFIPHDKLARLFVPLAAINPDDTGWFLLASAPLAGMAELVDAPDSKSGSGNRVGVRFPLPAPS